MSFAVAAMPRRIAVRAGRVPRRVRTSIAAALTVAVAGSGVAAGLLATQASDNASTQADRTAATAAAKTEIAQLLTYNYKTLNTDLARATADTTGQFSGEFGVMASQMIAPQAQQQQTVTRAVVPVAAAVDSSGNQVTVLVFVDQSTTNAKQPKAQVNGSQLRVTMQKVKNRWLIAQFQAM